MKKFYLLIILPMMIILSGCIKASEGPVVGYYEGPTLLSIDTTIDFDADFGEELTGIYTAEQPMAADISIDQDTPVVDQSIQEPAIKDTSKILKQENKDLSNKDIKFKKEVENQYKQEEINKNLDMLQEQQILLDSLLNERKKDIE